MLLLDAPPPTLEALEWAARIGGGLFEPDDPIPPDPLTLAGVLAARILRELLSILPRLERPEPGRALALPR